MCKDNGGRLNQYAKLAPAITTTSIGLSSSELDDYRAAKCPLVCHLLQAKQEKDILFHIKLFWGLGRRKQNRANSEDHKYFLLPDL